jgi:hypothetical protein
MDTFSFRPKPDRRRQPRIPPTDIADRANRRIRAEYLKKPDLHLTSEQARRPCGLSNATEPTP